MVNSRAENLSNLVNSEAMRLRDFLTPLGQGDWSRPSACVAWTVADVVAHLTQSSQVWAEVITRAAAGDANPPPGQRALQAGERGSAETAQRAIERRQQSEPKQLLEEFVNGYQRLCQILLGLQPDDWSKECFHRRGNMPMDEYVGVRVQELTVHGWDIRSAFDPSARLSEPALPVLVDRAHRWLYGSYRPLTGMPPHIRYRFDLSGPVDAREDVVVNPEGCQIRPASSAAPDVTLRCDTGTYILLVFGRLTVDEAMSAGKLKVEGDIEQAKLFSNLFQGF